jgi:hypothetical protein
MSRFKNLDITPFWDSDFFVNEQKKEIIIRKISFGEISKLQKQSVDARMTGTIQNVSFDVEKSRNMLVLAGIVSAPTLILENKKEVKFTPGDMIYVENLENSLGQYLYEQIEEFNQPSKND